MPKRRRPEPAADRQPQTGARVVVTVDELTHTGEAIAHLGGYVLFVRGLLPGERARVRVVQTKTRYGRAEIEEILHYSPARVEPRCRHFGECGRCSLQHLDYGEQLKYKDLLLRGVLERAMPGKRMPLKPILPAGDPWGARTKAHFAFGEKSGKPFLGHFAAHSHRLLPVVECPIHHPSANAAAFATLEVLEKHRVRAFDEDTGKGVARHAIARASRATGEALALLVTATAQLPDRQRMGEEVLRSAPTTKGIHLHVNPKPGPVVEGGETTLLAGEERIVERAAGIDFHLSPTAFFQTNVAAAELLVDLVVRAVPTEAKSVLDLYCGIGLFSVPLARKGLKVLGIEQNPQAVADAAETAERNGVAGCEFRSGKTEAVLKRLPSAAKYDVVVMDPPRRGAPEWVLRLLATRFRPQTIIDVSCDPESLGRDLALLTQAGYYVESIQPVDMFPHTSQIESVAVLRRTGAKKNRPPIQNRVDRGPGSGRRPAGKPSADATARAKVKKKTRK